MGDGQDVRVYQAYAQGLLSRKTAIQLLGMVDDVDAEVKQIEREQEAKYW